MLNWKSFGGWQVRQWSAEFAQVTQGGAQGKQEEVAASRKCPGEQALRHCAP